MKLGIVSAILDKCTFEQTIDTLSNLGFGCAEIACWPAGAPERRYAGVSHIDVERVLAEESYAEYIMDYARRKGISISALAYYPNLLDNDPAKRQGIRAHLMNVIRASAKLDVGMVATFIGRAQHKSIEENLCLVAEIWPPIIHLAEELNVKIAIENCPMLFGSE